MVEHVHHHNVAHGFIFVRKPAAIHDGVDPGCRRDVRGDDLRTEGFEESGACTEFDDGAIRPALVEDRSEIGFVDAA